MREARQPAGIVGVVPSDVNLYLSVARRREINSPGFNVRAAPGLRPVSPKGEKPGRRRSCLDEAGFIAHPTGHPARDGEAVLAKSRQTRMGRRGNHEEYGAAEAAINKGKRKTEHTEITEQTKPANGSVR